MSAETSETCIPDAGLILSLQSQLRSLRSRIQELEAENKNLSSQLTMGEADFREKNVEGHNGYADESSKMKTQSKKIKGKSVVEKNPGSVERLLAKDETLEGAQLGIGVVVDIDLKRESPFKEIRCAKSYVFRAKVLWFWVRGTNGTNSRALEKARLLIGDKKESFYSRCGRTDKGVSSIGQVVALFLRSNLKGSDTLNENCDQYFEEQYEKEIDYVKVINRVLPNDIRVLCWSPVPIAFSARFSCLSREYKYFFWKENLNISAMESAGKKFLGEHDFRNFCKMDAVNVHNYRRHVLSLDICPCDARFEVSQLWAIKVKGTAFLWHQVRCMVAVLFMIGQGFESPDVIDVLLDTWRTPRKPQYTMALEIPLVLESCEFEGLNFRCSAAARQALCEHLFTERRSYELQVAMRQMALLNSLPLPNDDWNSLDNGITKKKVSHVPLLSRPTEPSYEERRAKFNSRSKSTSSIASERAS